ncbi:MAG: hypothetical protein J6C37_02035 [Roseburia sp.]|nr:hypothetical protein [Roseburia sp.]
MIRKIKSYLIFTPVFYRWLMFLMVPAGTIGLQWLIEPIDLFMTGYINVMIWVMVEIISDNWVFGGMAVAGGKQWEYVKTSKRGMPIVENALGVNMARQFLEGMIIFIAGWAFFSLRNGRGFSDVGELIIYVDMLLMAYFVIVAALSITRFFDSVLINTGTASLASILLVGGFALVAAWKYVMLVLLVILAAAVSVMGVKLIMWRVRESYYDRADKKEY